MDTSTPKDAKIRVDKATAGLTKTRCLITNVECDTMVDYAHVLACAVGNDEYEMDKLEYSWDMVWRTQNIHTRRNIFRLSAKFHRLFDANKWLLLPETHIIDQINEGLRSKVFPKIKEKAYKYKLVAHPDMKQVPIHRRDENIPMSPSAFKKFIYPFEGFPDIISHVHPRFVIYNTGCKIVELEEFFAFTEGSTKEVYDALKKVTNIFKVWRRATPDAPFYEDRNKPKAQSNNVKPDREGMPDICYAESSDSSTPPTSRSRKQSTRSVVDGTPGERALEYRTISDKAKERVDEVAAKRCLIENTDEANALDYAHLLRRSTKDATLTGLEYSWGMPYDSLNIDTRRNIFRLSRNFHRLFDGEAWILLPDVDIIEQYFQVRKDPENLPVFDSPTSHYTLIVNNLMEHVPIHVQRNKSSALEDAGDANDDEPSNVNISFNLEDAFATHTYPFRHFPPIISHVHPRFVICNAGAKLEDSNVALRFIETNPEHGGIIRKLLKLYQAWKNPNLPSDFVETGTSHRDKPAGDFPDDKTEPGRLPPPQAKRPLSPPEGDGSPKPRKRAKSGGGKDSAWLDDTTLGGLDPDRSPKKAWQDKVEWIQTWVGQVPLDAMEEIPMEIDLEDKSVCRTGRKSTPFCPNPF